MNKINTGKLGEMLAKRYLSDKGYKITESNYRCSYGEIDIIAENGNKIVFIEVKYRQSLTYGYPREAVTKRKQEKLRKTAEHYIMQKQCFDFDYGFDVIEILRTNSRLEIEHIENAF